MPQVDIQPSAQVDPPKPSLQTRLCTLAPSDLPKPSPPFDPHKPTPQYHYQSNAEDQQLIDKLVSSCHRLPPSYLIFFSFLVLDLWTAFSVDYITYLWTVLAFSRDFHTVPQPSLCFHRFL